jgi:hypothetical protein
MNIERFIRLELEISYKGDPKIDMSCVVKSRLT